MRQMAPSAVTVVVPYWDLDPAFLITAIESVAQAHPPRTIVVDNASERPLPELPEWVEVMRLPHRVSLGAARNAALAQVETPWVLFLDADDLLAAGTFDRWLAAAGRHPSAVVIRGPARRWQEGSTTPDPAGHRGWRRVLDERPGLRAVVNTFHMCIGTATALLRTDAVRAAGGFADVAMEEDWVLSAVLAFHGDVVRVPEAHQIRRKRGDSMTATRPDDWSRSVVARRELRRRLRQDPHVPRWIKAGTPLLALLHGKPRLMLIRARLSRS